MPELWLHDGTAPRKARELYYHDGTAVRKVKEAWYHDGTAPRRIYSGAGVVVPLPTLSTGAFLSSPGTATASITWRADGGITAAGRAAKAWYEPAEASIGAGYWLRVTKVSGATPSGITLGSWLALSTARSATLSVTGAGRYADCSLTYAISADGGATTIATGAATINVETGE